MKIQSTNVDLIQFKIFHVDNKMLKNVTEGVLQHHAVVQHLQFKDVEQFQHSLEQHVELSFKMIVPKDVLLLNQNQLEKINAIVTQKLLKDVELMEPLKLQHAETMQEMHVLRDVLHQNQLEYQDNQQ
jgi:hypothetical protein